MAHADAVFRRRRFGETSRRDAWWRQPLAVFLGLSAFIIYATWAMFQFHTGYHEFGPYLSPFYSPLLFGTSPHAWFGGPDVPVWWPSALPYSAAFLILWMPGGFRFTCYYYRGAYYKAFWADPPACAVGEPRSGYRGERRFPLVLQNVHRYFLYLALGFLVVLAYDVYKAMWFTDATGREEFGIGLGTLILAANVTLLGCYTLGCHSMRHIVGGYLDRLSLSPVRKKAYDCSSCLNRRHMRWAWMSLFSVAFSDLYVRLCSMGILSDWRIY
ncbi:MAG TPA: succinate dehydrogenase [Blastocatellia bacterium]|nr:succinate dehydrogenase [Blastocatellia bacterium]